MTRRWIAIDPSTGKEWKANGFTGTSPELYFIAIDEEEERVDYELFTLPNGEVVPVKKKNESSEEIK